MILLPMLLATTPSEPGLPFAVQYTLILWANIRALVGAEPSIQLHLLVKVSERHRKA